MFDMLKAKVLKLKKMKSLLLYRLVKRKGRGFVATLVRYRRVEIRELAQRLSDTSHMLRESMALSMLTVFPQVLKEELMKNNSVHIDGLGTFSLHMQSETVDSPHEFHMNSSPIKLDLNRPKQTLN